MLETLRHSFPLILLAAVSPAAGLASTIPAGPISHGAASAGDERRDEPRGETPSIEAEILRTLRENGVISEVQFRDLTALADKLRRERSETHNDLDREIRRLSEVLQERAQSAPAPNGTAATVYFRDGFRFRTDDGKFELHPWFVVRERFTFLNPGSRPGLAGEDTASFETRPARLWFDGHIGTEDLTYLLMIDTASAAGILRDAWFDYRFDDAFHLRAGQQKRLVSRQGFTYAPRTALVDKSAAAYFFQGVDFDPGLTAWGEVLDRVVEWRAGVFNGEGANNGATTTSIGPASGGLTPVNSNNNDSSGLEAIARLTVNPMGPFPYAEGDYGKTPDPKLSFGAWLSHNPERNPGGVAPMKTKAEIYTWGVDAAFKWMGLYATAEVYQRKTDRYSSAMFDTIDNGYMVQAGHFFGSETPNRGFEGILRWSVVDIDGANLMPGATGEVHDATAGLNYLFNGHRLKIQSAYTLRTEGRINAHSITDHIFQLQLQVVF